uniref:DUF4422 domain-containing protein n=1 Tax=Rosenbergiella metrosideri TaxID=2921185 RepID=UPI001F4FC212
NMFIMKSSIFDEYCSWVFPIILELHSRIDTTPYDAYQKRVIGFLAERLFNVWIEYNKNRFRIKYLNVLNTEGENLVKKGYGLIKRMMIK